MTNDDSLLDYLSCPVCFEAPEAKVFQCKEGHLICEKCYIQLTKCPECRTPYDPANPIRSRASEAIMRDRVTKIDCSFKSNGCQKRFRRNEINNHQVGCHFNFEKFGEFINLCKLVGFTQCDFQVNSGNSKEDVEHFISEHGCILTKKIQFKMELLEVKDIKSGYSDSINFWTPIIVDLEKRKCYLLTMALLKQKDNSISWFSIYLPYHKQEGRENEDILAAGIQLNYALSNESDLARPCPNWSSLQNPITLSNAELLLPSQLPWGFNLSGLKGYFTQRGSLLITIQYIVNGCRNEKALDKTHRLNRFQCSRKTFTPDSLLVDEEPDLWLLEQGSQAGNCFLLKTRDDCLRDRRKCLPFLENIFGQNCMANGLNLKDINWLRKSAIFLTAKLGDIPAIKYLLEMRSSFPSIIKLNILSMYQTTPIFETLFDTDKKLALEKAQILVQYGASLQIVSKTGENLLHQAAQFGNVETLKYFSKRGLHINAKNVNGKAPVHFAFYAEDRAVGLQNAKYLLEEAGVPLETTGLRERTLLHYAAQFSAPATEYFLQKGLNVNRKDEDGLTPLHLAANNFQEEKEEFVEEIVKILLRNGADKRIKCDNRLTPLKYVNEAFKNVQKLLRKRVA